MKLAHTKDCTGCFACIDSCKQGALYKNIDQYGYVEVKINAVKCIECGLCTKNCPILNKKYSKDKIISRKAEAYAAWNTNLTQRNQSASGGAFSAIASIFLDEGAIVYGAMIDGFDIKHIRIEDKIDLPLILGTKYQHSDMTGIYNQIQKDLKNGKIVLFSGMSCQVAGVLSFIRDDYKKNLYTIDTICSGISTQLPMMHIKECGKYKGIKCFRDKSNGWRSKGFKYSLKIEQNDGSIKDFGVNNIVLDTFSTRLLKRSSCLNCHFNGLTRNSDCTIGDYWGDNDFKSEHNNGLSAIIVHNNRIMRFIGDSSLETAPTEIGKIRKNNPYITWSNQTPLRYMWSRKKALKALKNKDYETAEKQFSPWSHNGLILRLYLKLHKGYETIIEYFEKRKN